MLHGGLIDATLHLWAESATRSGAAATLASASHPELSAALAGVLGKPRTLRADASACSVFAWLPGDASGFAPSSSLLDVPAPAATGVLRPYAIDALVPGDLALETLLITADRPVFAPGVLVGDDLAFWSRAFIFAARLVAAGRYIPSLDVEGEKRDARYRARWRPLMGPAERSACTSLGATMPAASRALSSGANVAPAHPAGDVLRAFLESAVDRLVRASPSTTAAKPAIAGGALHDRWLSALRSADATVAGTPTELRPFAEAVATWRRDLAREEDAEYRLSLRVEEPTHEGGPWFVRYLLQSQADRSLLVTADVAWKNGTLRRPMLEAVGRAARLSPRIDATLQEPQPHGFALDDAAAHDFLTKDAPFFESAGVGTLLPSWWTTRGTQLRLAARAHAKSPAGSSAGFTLNTIVAVNWKVALGDETLSARELAELAKLKSPLVRLRGQWVVVEPADIRAALELRERRTASMRIGDLVRLSLTGSAPETRLPVADVRAGGELETLLGRLHGRVAFAELPVPSALQATLRPYQVRGYSWLHFLSRLGLGAALADDMGLGKTVQTLALIARDWAEGLQEPVLLVCPTSVIGNWQREAARFVPDLPVVVHHGAQRERGRLLPKNKPVALVVTSYGLVQRDLAALRRIAWRGIVLDEAQNVKNAESKGAKAVRALPASYRIALTGTPIENHVGDLWSLMEFLNPGLLGTSAAFRRDFLIPIATHADLEAEARLKTLTAPFVLRRLKSDRAVIADLPKKLEMRVFCQLTKEQASLYAAVLRDVEERLAESEGMARKGLVLATLMKLKQVCNHPANLLHDDSPLPKRSGKLNRLGEMLEEVRESGDRALVFTQFTEMAAMIKRYLQETTGREVLYLHGGVGKAERDRMVAAFQEAPNAPTTFVLSLRAGGTGLNLTRANHVFHFDRWWNPAVENQASDRVYRIGQTKNVQIHRFVCAGTVEDQIDALLERKSALATRLVRSGEGGLTELSNDALREVFALRADAIGEG